MRRSGRWPRPRHGRRRALTIRRSFRRDLGGELLIAYLMPKESQDLRSFVNYWLRIQHVNGFNERMVARWIEGKPNTVRRQRWSFVRQIDER